MTIEVDRIPQPRNGLVMVRREKKRDTTDAGIILPSGGVEGEYDVAVILKIGPGTPGLETGKRMGDIDDLEVGQRVVVKTMNARYTASRVPGARNRSTEPRFLPFKIDGEVVELINQGDIIVIL